MKTKAQIERAIYLCFMTSGASEDELNKGALACAAMALEWAIDADTETAKAFGMGLEQAVIVAEELELIHKDS